MLLIINPYFKLNYHFNCAPWIDGFPHSDTVYLHIQLLLYSSSETFIITLLLELVYHLLKVIAYILNW
ncbi:hypothetical protein PAPYR_12002 [Paratrimastix pyriformis]|uniref:Uncharacterized protein n=1 Tax=Paratrimastix pyriformis TaxID=342808 RepID=A0ABQ8U2N5_9EUKA|nr:hypothetical protein PAPYR_12002 [Paratrimastix pyriformis]